MEINSLVFRASNPSFEKPSSRLARLSRAQPWLSRAEPNPRRVPVVTVVPAAPLPVDRGVRDSWSTLRRIADLHETELLPQVLFTEVVDCVSTFASNVGQDEGNELADRAAIQTKP